MGFHYNTYLDGTKVYVCKACKTHLALLNDVVSRDFHGQLGTAYLFDNVVNVERNDMEIRQMKTGKYKVQDIQCRICSKVVGWVYVEAYSKSECYKEGKFILEVSRIYLVPPC